MYIVTSGDPRSVVYLYAVNPSDSDRAKGNG